MQCTEIVGQPPDDIETLQHCLLSSSSHIACE
jgi:hypothetical protein